MSADSTHTLPASTAASSGRFRLFGRLALLVVVPLLLLTIAAVINARQEFAAAESAALESASVIARQAAARIDEHYDEQDQFLDAVGEAARDVLTRGADGDPMLRRLIRAMPQFMNGLSILSLDGRMLASTTATPEGRATVTVADRAYFKDAVAKRRLVVGEPLLSRTNNQWVLVSGRPVLDESGSPIGVVSMSFRIDRFHDVLVPLGLPLGALMTVFNDRGVGISSTAEPVAAVGRDFTGSPAVKRALKELAYAEQTTASDGHKRLTAYAAGEKLPWIVEVGLPIEETLAPAKEKFVLRLQFLFAAFVVGLMVAYALVQWIARPIRRLTQDAEKLGSGDLAVRTAVRGYYELNQLATAFNGMASAVERNEQALKVNEERFRSLVFLSSDWYWVQDVEHRFVSHTQGRFDEIGLSAEDYRGKTRWDMQGAEPIGATWDAHRAKLAARESWRDLIVRYIDRTGKAQYISSSGEPAFDAHGEFTGYRGVARLVTERFELEAKRVATEMALRESEERLRTTLDYSPNVAVQWFDRDGRIRYWNRASTLVFGWHADEVIGRTLEEIRLYTPEQCLAFMTALRAVDREGPRAEPTESTFRRKDGSEGALISTLFAIPSPKGESFYACMDIDVSPRVRLEKELKERVELFGITLDTTPVAIGLVRRRDNALLLANRMGYDMFRVADSEKWDVTANWKRKDDMREMLQRIEREGEARDMEIPVSARGRENMWALLSAKPATYQGESVLVVTLNDISERKALESQREAAEGALRESEAKFRALTALSSDWYWEQDDQMRFTHVGSDDPRWAAPMLGKTRWDLDGEPLGMTWAEHQAQLQRREVFRNLVFRYTVADGASAWLSVNGEPYFDAAGTFRGYRGTATSVTVRHQLELELQERMALFQTTLDTSPVATALVRVSDNVVLLANQSAYKAFHVDPQTKVWNVLDHRDRPDDLREFTRRIKRDGFVRDMEVPVLVKDRGRAWMTVAAQPGRLHDEAVMVVTMHDITERKSLEVQRDAAAVALRASEAKFRALAELSTDWFWEQDAQYKFTSVGSKNEHWALSMVGKAVWELDGEPIHQTWDEFKAQVHRHERFRDTLFRYRTKDGVLSYLSASGEPTFDEAGLFCGYRGSTSDVTERVRLEEMLRMSETKFRALTALSSDWYWEQDANLRFTFIGREEVSAALPVIGKTREELNAEPVDVTREVMQARLARREKFRDVVFRYTTVDGATHYVSTNGEPIFDGAGAFCGYRGTGTDVTRRITLESELKERVELFRVTLEATPVTIGLIRRHDNAVLLANSAAYRMFNVKTAEGDFDVMSYWERREDMKEMLRRVKQEGSARDMGVPIRVPGREPIWGLVSALPARYAGDEVLVVTVNDITDLRSAHERLRLLSRQILDVQEAERRQIAHELHDEIGQNLSALKLFAGHLRSDAPPALHQAIDEWVAVVDLALSQVRDLSRLLRPVQLDHMGLAFALRAMLDTQARAAGWVTTFEFAGDEARFDPRLETACYRFAQEALTNIGRHAAAASVTLRVRRTDREIKVEIEDDGRGFDMVEAQARMQKGRSMGLLGMAERVQLAGGQFKIDSAPANGTRLTAVIPLLQQQVA